MFSFSLPVSSRAVTRKMRWSSDRLSPRRCHSLPHENRQIQKMWKYDHRARTILPSPSNHCLFDWPQPKKSSMIDVAYTAMNSAVSVVDSIKSKLVAAREPGVDKSKVQAEITQLQQQLTSIA